MKRVQQQIQHTLKVELLSALLILLFTFFTVLISSKNAISQSKGELSIINMVFTSDAHYGITRAKFKGETHVNSQTVNEAMIEQINRISGENLPLDGGINAGHRVGGIDFLIETGDIANRMEIPIQSASKSWSQFDQDYLHGLKTEGHSRQSTRILLAPGNHDISNAIGFYKPMYPLKDATSMVMIYNLMMKPVKPLTNETYNYDTNKINYSLNINGIHLIFITLWPDSIERIWMKKDLDSVSHSTPVIIFTHDQPDCEAKHFTNPVIPHTISTENKFENLLAENYKDGNMAKADGGNTDVEQREFVNFLKEHPNIKAYFHGNSNWNEFYVYKGPDKNVNLNVFRVDSPMKGKYSSKDETKLSFQLISLDSKNKKLSVRECLWNSKPADSNQKVVFGQSSTISLEVN